MNATKPTIETITKQFEIATSSLFYTDGKLDFDETIDALISLANMVNDIELDDNGELWAIGEHEMASLDCLLIGVHWFATEYHGGQSSPVYALLSATGSFYSPGFVSGPDPENGEKDAYDAMVDMYNSNFKTG